MITYTVFAFPEIKEPLHHPRRRPRHRHPPTSRRDQPNLHVNMSPIRYFEMFLLIFSTIEMAIKFECSYEVDKQVYFLAGKFHVLDMSFFYKDN